MFKKIDSELKARAVRLVNDHHGEYRNVTAASFAMAKQLGGVGSRCAVGSPMPRSMLAAVQG